MKLPPYSVEDGFGSSWFCPKALPVHLCGLEVVRPGKAQCEKCRAEDERAALERTTKP